MTSSLFLTLQDYQILAKVPGVARGIKKKNLKFFKPIQFQTIRSNRLGGYRKHIGMSCFIIKIE